MSKEYYFKDGRLRMTVFGRFLIRLFSFFTYGILLATGVILFLSDLKELRAVGMLVGLFILDRLVHINKPERSLARLRCKNVCAYLSPETYRIIEMAYDRAIVGGGDFSLHLLKVLLKHSEIEKVLIRLDVKPKEFLAKTNKYLQETIPAKHNKQELIGKVEKVILMAFQHAKKHYENAIEPHDVLGAIGEIENEHIKRLFTLFDIQMSDIETAFLFGKSSPKRLTGFFGKTYKVRDRVMNRAWTARPTPILDRYGKDLTGLARAGKGGFLVGHRTEYQRLINVLSRPDNPNALLIGEPGTGKETLVAHLAFQIIKDRVPKPLFDKRLVSLAVSQLAASDNVPGTINKILEEIAMAGNVILYIPDIHDLLKTGEAKKISGADILIPIINEGNFSVIGGTFPKEYKNEIRSNNDFSSAFEPIRIEELSEAEATQYLVLASLVLERKTKIIISFGAVKKAVTLAHKYFRDKLLPSCAEDLLNEALADAIEKKKKILNADDVIETAEMRTNIEIHKAKGEEAEGLLELEKTIHQKFIDQDEAVKAVSNSLREYRSGLSRQGGPIATFLFVGSTGVGKTELSKILTEIQFGSKDMMVRFDMSEYQDKQSFFRLIGSPDGSIPGSLTEAIKEKPYSLILLDEFEKAHPDIVNIFLQVFDDGRLTDNLGSTVNFQNTIIIATSNAHSNLIKDEIEKGTGVKEIAEILKKRITEYFKPELVNRFSGIMVFKSLNQEEIVEIARLNLKKLTTTMQEAQAVDLKFDESAVRAIARLGYDPVFGARPLRKVISEKLRSVLAEKVLKGEIEKGSTIMVSFEDDFIFTKAGE